MTVTWRLAEATTNFTRQLTAQRWQCCHDNSALRICVVTKHRHCKELKSSSNVCYLWSVGLPWLFCYCHAHSTVACFCYIQQYTPTQCMCRLAFEFIRADDFDGFVLHEQHVTLLGWNLALEIDSILSLWCRVGVWNPKVKIWLCEHRRPLIKITSWRHLPLLRQCI